VLALVVFNAVVDTGGGNREKAPRAIRHGFDCIPNEIDDNLLHLNLVDPDPGNPDLANLDLANLDPFTPDLRATLLDLGSGAGFPGLPIALLRPGLEVTLAESQNKKAAFLREAVRTLNLPNVEVWAARAETMPADRQFRIVALRAVDNMEAALSAAKARIAPGGLLALLTTVQHAPNGGGSLPLPNSQSGILHLQTF